MLAQQNMTSPSVSDENRRLKMLLSNRNMGLGKDGLTNSVGDVVPNVGSPLQAGGPFLARGDTDTLIKVIFTVYYPSICICFPYISCCYCGCCVTLPQGSCVKMLLSPYTHKYHGLVLLRVSIL